MDHDVRMFGGAVNAYQQSPLRGCLADAQAMFRLYERNGWPVGQKRLQLDDRVTNADLRNALDWLVGEPTIKRSLLVLSGHGARRQRRAANSADPTEEFYCPYDVMQVWDSPDLVNDQYLEAMFGKVPPNGKHIFFAYCCHSGGVANASLDDAAGITKALPLAGATPKTLSGPWDAGLPVEPAAPKMAQRVQENVFEDNSMGYVWFAAARSDQYSYEVNGLDGPFDVSRKALETVLAADPGLSVRKAHGRVVEWIRDTYNFDQTPQLWGPARLLDSDFFS